jgi:peptidyl-prolyl cis-trans isomerase C
MKNLSALLVVIALSVCLASCKKPGSESAPAGSLAPASAPASSPAAAPAAGQPAPGGAAAIPGVPAAAKPMPANIPNVLARVNGEAIERWEFDNAVRRTEQRAGGPVPPERRDEVLRGILDQLVTFHLLAQESRARKLGVTDAEVDARLAQIKQSFPNEQAFAQSITAQGLTLDQVKLQTKTSIEVQKIIDSEISSKVSVQDPDVEAFYKGNMDRFKQGESIHAAHILFGVPPNANAEQKAEVKAKAEAALKKIKGGADFAAVAKAESQDPGSAQNGGDLGFFPKGQMTPNFEEAAFKLKPGQMSGLVETPFGYHIIKVTERRPARTAPFAEVSDQIKNFLIAGQREQKLEAFVEQLKAKGKIQSLV